MKRRILQIGGILFALLLISFLGWRIKLANDVSGELQAIRAAGLPVNGEELNQFYPSVPDSENAALVITQAFALMANYPDERSNQVVKFKLTSALQPLTADQRELMSGYVESNQLAIQKAITGIQLKKSRYPIDFSPGTATLLWHLAYLWDLAQAIEFQGVLAGENGDPMKAAESTGIIIGLSRTLEKEPTLISALVRFRMDNMAKLSLERILNEDSLKSESFDVLSNAFQGLEETNGLYAAMVGERAMDIPLFRMNFAQFTKYAETRDEDVRNIHGGIESLVVTALVHGSGWMERDLQFYLQLMQTNIGLSTNGPPSCLEITNIWGNAMKVITPQFHILSALTLPALDTAYFREADAIANIRVARAALAVEQFRLLNNRLPASLDALAISTETHTDPYNGQPLHYRLLQKGYVIYSVGRDEHDNNGRERPADAKFSDKTEYDITFTVGR